MCNGVVIAPRGALAASLLLLVGLFAAPAVSHAQRAGAAPPPAAGKTADDDVDGLSRAGDARAFGSDSARVTIIEFLDFACPVCAAFYVQRSDSLRKLLGPDVKMVYVNFPLQQHMRSFHGSEAAMCAGSVGGHAGFSAMVDKLYRQQSEWSSAFDPGAVFSRFAKEAALDSAAFAACRARDMTAPIILADLGTAAKFSVEGTPTFVMIPRGAQSADDTINASGNLTIAQLTKMLGDARAKAK